MGYIGAGNELYEKEHISIDELRTDSFIYIVSEFICANSECEYSKIRFIEKHLITYFLLKMPTRLNQRN